MKRNIQLLIIDGQIDFCDLPADYLPTSPIAQPGTDNIIRPGLPVTGAHADMLRLADLINKSYKGIEDISPTMDTHRIVGIERPAYWKTASGAEVSPFTQITEADVRQGKFLPRNPKLINRTLAYLKSLEAQGRYTLMVWPVHCVVGTWGHGLHPNVLAAINRWEIANVSVANYVAKGNNPFTEHYSALQAEVPDANDPTTQLNRGFIDLLTQADQLLVAGEAGSHCVKATVEHLVDNFGANSLSKIVLLTDTISPVTGFEKVYEDFLTAMRARGLQTATTVDVAPELIANGRR